jgi:hypothetical protein
MIHVYDRSMTGKTGNSRPLAKPGPLNFGEIDHTSLISAALGHVLHLWLRMSFSKHHHVTHDYVSMELKEERSKQMNTTP